MHVLNELEKMKENLIKIETAVIRKNKKIEKLSSDLTLEEGLEDLTEERLLNVLLRVKEELRKRRSGEKHTICWEFWNYYRNRGKYWIRRITGLDIKERFTREFLKELVEEVGNDASVTFNFELIENDIFEFCKDEYREFFIVKNKKLVLIGERTLSTIKIIKEAIKTEDYSFDDLEMDNNFEVLDELKEE